MTFNGGAGINLPGGLFMTLNELTLAPFNGGAGINLPGVACACPPWPVVHGPSMEGQA